MTDHLARAHQVKRRLEEIVNYPAHAPRVATPEFRAARHRLIVEQDRPCIACGVRQSTLGDPAHNHYKATGLEAHHWEIELAFANAIDPEKFYTKLAPYLRAKYPNDPRYQRVMTTEELYAWIDHDEANLKSICNVHHRGSGIGIHEVTLPIWRVIDLVRDDFLLIPDGNPVDPPAPLT